MVLAMAGQTPADLYLVEEYRAWAARQKEPPDLNMFKNFLIEQGADSVDAETQIRTIRAMEGRDGADGFRAFLEEVTKGRKPGKVEKGKLDLIILTSADFRGKEEAIVKSLRPGGLLVVDGPVTKMIPGLRVLRSTDKYFAAERPR